MSGVLPALVAGAREPPPRFEAVPAAGAGVVSDAVPPPEGSAATFTQVRDDQGGGVVEAREHALQRRHHMVGAAETIGHRRAGETEEVIALVDADGAGRGRGPRASGCSVAVPAHCSRRV